MRQNKDVRTAVVGCGYWGKNLVRNFASLSTLKACCDTTPAVRERLSRDYPDVRVTADYEDVLRADDVDAVVLATPAVRHAAMAVEALEAGKHVFVEKPLALTVEDAERVVETVDRTGRIAMVGHLLMYHPAIEYLKTLVQRGELGDVYYCYSQRVNLGKLRRDENSLWSLAPHDISVMLYLLGEAPEQVEATGQAFLQPGIEDVVFVTLKFASGRVAHLQVSWLDPHKERRLTVVGSRKMAVFDDMQAREKVRIYDKGVTRSAAEATPYANYGEALSLRDGEIVIPSLSNQEPLALECGAFLDAVRTGEPPRSDARNGLEVVRVLERAQEKLAAARLVYQGA